MSEPMSLLGVLLQHSLASVVGPATVSLPLAFGAGILSTLNPCGFVLLPAYVSYTVRHQVLATPDGQPSSWRQLLQGGLLGLPLAAGFLLVFLVAAGVLALGGRLVVHLFPWLALVVGAGLVLLGGWTLLTRREVRIPWIPELPRLGAPASKLSHAQPASQVTLQVPEGSETQAEASPAALRAAWIFGLGYGLSSLGCALPIFVLVVGTAIIAGGVGDALLVLASYAAGMALVLLAVALAATTVGDLLRSAVFPLLRWVQPVAALLLIAAGSYIIVYQVRAGLW